MGKEIRKVILSEIDSEAFYREYFPDIEFGVDGQTIENVVCPFHGGESLSINKDSGWKCWGCEKSGDLISFYRYSQKKTMSDDRAIKKLYNRYVHPIPSATELNLWHKELMKSPVRIKELKEKRGINTADIRNYQIGYDKQDKSYTLPIKGPWGFNHDIRKIRLGLSPEMAKHKNKPYDYRTAKTKKTRGEKTHGSGGRLFPYRNLQCEKLILCEGEFDCILLNSLGFTAVTTGGCTSWKRWYPELKGKDIIICFDNDDPRKSSVNRNAGQDAAKKVKEDLFTLTKSIKNIVLPMFGDVTDYFMDGRTKEDFEELLGINDEEPKDEEIIEEEEKLEAVVLESIGDIRATEFHNKYVEVISQVVGEKKKEYAIVTDYTLKCEMDRGDKCDTCPMMAEDGRMKGRIKPFGEDGRFLSYMDMKDKEVVADIADFRGAPKACPSIVLQRDKVESIQQITVSPPMQRTKVKRSENGPTVFNLTGSLELNQDYLLKGKVTHNPKDQTHCLIVDSAEKIKSDITNFRKMESEELADMKEKFNPKSTHPDDIVAKHDSIMEVYARNITKIYGRRDLHSFIDLTFHSPLQIMFDGVLERSYIETALIGDTNTGKNKVVDAMTEHFSAGLVVDAASCTYAGLVASTDKSGDFEWGLYVRQHGRFLGLDEGKHLKTTIEALRTVREGKADYTKAYAKRQTVCMVRLVIMANDPYGVISSNPHGIMALPALFNREADLSRFTLACFLKKEDTDTDLINKRKPPEIETHLTQEDFQKRVANAWTLSPEQIIFTEKAIDECYEQAKRMAAKYSDTIPLVQAATQWKKIASIAAALASSLFNMKDNGMELKVCSNYVKAACMIIERHYDSEDCGYKQFSAQEKERETIVDKKAVKSRIFDREKAEKDGDVAYSIKQLLAVREFDSEYFADCFTVFKSSHTGKEGLRILLRNNCIVRDGKNYVKTKVFTKFLKELHYGRNQKEDQKEDQKEEDSGKSKANAKRRTKTKGGAEERAEAARKHLG